MGQSILASMSEPVPELRDHLNADQLLILETALQLLKKVVETGNELELELELATNQLRALRGLLPDRAADLETNYFGALDLALTELRYYYEGDLTGQKRDLAHVEVAVFVLEP